jgi:hypothetical protein
VGMLINYDKLNFIYSSFQGDAAETDDNIAISNENEGMEGSQDANDAFQIQSVEKNP